MTLQNATKQIPAEAHIEDQIKDFKLANQYLREGQFQAAIVFYQYALQQNPASSAIYENLGDALYQSQQYQDAAAAYQSAISLNAQSAYAHAQLGRICFQQQRYSAAIAPYRQAIALHPTCIPYSHDLAQTLLALDRSIEASKVYKRLGAVLRHEGLREDAIAAYQKAVTLQSTAADVHQAIGECYHLQGNFSAAIHHYQQVADCACEPLHLWFYKNWGEAILSEAAEASVA